MIRPYAFDVVPEVFENPVCEVVAIAAERTFWEKATILHQEAHRKTQIPQRYSRHYYDRICLPRRKEDDNTGTRLQRQVERLSGLDRNDWIRGPRDLVS